MFYAIILDRPNSYVYMHRKDVGNIAGYETYDQHKWVDAHVAICRYVCYGDSRAIYKISGYAKYAFPFPGA